MRQFLLSAPINTSGFKIALELLLKTPYTSAGSLAEQPYSFGLRQVGSSKLSSKVMLKYVGQLLTLYAWAWGLFFHGPVAGGVAAAVFLGQVGLHELQRRRGGGEVLPGGLWNRGRASPNGETKRMV